MFWWQATTQRGARLLHLQVPEQQPVNQPNPFGPLEEPAAFYCHACRHCIDLHANMFCEPFTHGVSKPRRRRRLKPVSPLWALTMGAILILLRGWAMSLNRARSWRRLGSWYGSSHRLRRCRTVAASSRSRRRSSGLDSTTDSRSHRARRHAPRLPRAHHAACIEDGSGPDIWLFGRGRRVAARCVDARWVM